MPFWSRRPKDAEGESSEQTLARLQSAAAESTDHLSAGAHVPAGSFRLQRGGYNIAEGYNEDDVDQLLDAVTAQRASER